MTPEYKERMTTLLTRLGAGNAAQFLSSEQNENIPQVAHFLFVHEVRKVLAETKLGIEGQNASPQETLPDQIIRAGENAVRALSAVGTPRSS